MNADTFLRQAQFYSRRIELKLREYEHIMDLATRITSVVRPDPSSPSQSDRIGNAAVRLADISREIDAISDQYAQVKGQIESVLAQLPEQEYAVIHSIYMNGLTQEQTADAMLPNPLCVRQVQRIKASAMRHVQAILDADPALCENKNQPPA